MSKIGKKPVEVPAGVTVDQEAGQLRVSGPRGQIQIEIPTKISLEISGGKILVKRSADDKKVKALHGLYRQKINNALKGVTAGFSKTLELVGAGFKANVSDNILTIAVGFSHPVEISAPPGIAFGVEQNKIIVSGSDRELVGQIAADIRKIKPPEPYKGKGIRYEGEQIRKKAGKAAKVGLGTPGQ